MWLNWRLSETSEQSIALLKKDNERLNPTPLTRLNVDLRKAEQYGDEPATLNKHNLTHLANKKPLLDRKANAR